MCARDRERQLKIERETNGPDNCYFMPRVFQIASHSLSRGAGWGNITDPLSERIFDSFPFDFEPNEIPFGSEN